MLLYRQQQLGQPLEVFDCCLSLFFSHLEVNTCLMFNPVFFILATVSSNLFDHSLTIPNRDHNCPLRSLVFYYNP